MRKIPDNIWKKTLRKVREKLKSMPRSTGVLFQDDDLMDNLHQSLLAKPSSRSPVDPVRKPQDPSAMNDTDLLNHVFSVQFRRFSGYQDVLARGNAPQRLVFVLQTFDMEVMNGGLCQFFLNSSRVFAPYVADCLRQLQLDRIADAYQTFVEKYRLDLNDLSDFDTESIASYKEKAERYPYEELEAVFTAQYDQFNNRLAAYIREHIGEVLEETP